MPRRGSWVAPVAAVVLVAGCTFQAFSLRAILEQSYDPDRGVYAELGNYLFGTKIVRTGLIRPERFTNAIGFGLFLTEPHVPGRVPVVLVHGHASGPRALRDVAAILDPERFEPWYGYYATGASIPSSAALLRQSLSRVAADLGVDRVVLVGYSQGGLVTRAALGPAHDDASLPAVPLYLCLSVPWGGSRIAVSTGNGEREGGPDSWKEMASGSEFIVHLFDDLLPGGTAMHIFYGLGGDSKRFGVENDGTIEGPSLARPEALAEAASVNVFPGLRHGEVEASPQVHARIVEILGTLPR